MYMHICVMCAHIEAEIQPSQKMIIFGECRQRIYEYFCSQCSFNFSIGLKIFRIKTRKKYDLKFTESFQMCNRQLYQ